MTTVDPKLQGTTYDYDEDLLHLDRYCEEHAAEIAAELDKPFALTEGTSDEIRLTGAVAVSSTGVVIDPVAAATTELVAADQPVAAAAAAVDAAPVVEEKGRESNLKRISKMKVGERVKLAMLGNKEERAILIRDGSKVVSSAVLASPKLSDSEVETIAGMKNVQQSVLRDIQRNRKFMKNYNVVKNLINNPRCPLDLSLTMVKNLQVNDLKFLSMNKNVPETLKKVALKNFKEKSGPQR
jgi:hypothetical protein